ncbi:hypothetical protein NDGK_03118 [Clostridiales bacterium CHKCI001]|nr:hypothetical protein NDGK_03118 [Clostridiales bacterium CHKCI001]
MGLTVKPDLVITYTIKPNIYGGIICRLLRIPYAENITGLSTAFQTENLIKKLYVSFTKSAIDMPKLYFSKMKKINKFFLIII